MSRRIRQIEQQIGVALFERTGAGVRTTSAGADFLRGARRLIEQAEAMAHTAKASGRGEHGTLRLGFYASISAGNLRATIIDYRRRFPEVGIHLVQDLRERLLAGLELGSLDIAIVTGNPSGHGAGAMALWSERLLVALPDRHPLAGSRDIQWTDLRDETFLLARHEASWEMRDFITGKLGSAGGPPKVFRHDVNGEAIRCLVGSGFGVSLVSDAAIGTVYPGVVYLEPRDGAEPCRLNFMAQWDETNSNPALATFLGLLRERHPIPPRAERSN